jgi:hypothetical protein
MSHERSASTTPRRPFALRELFCLMTLAAASVALILYDAWNEHERWLLGLTLGGALLGVAAARMRQRRGWLVGVLAGTLGGCTAIWIIYQDWSVQLDEYASQGFGAGFMTKGHGAEDLAEFRNDYLAAAAIIAVLGVLIALSAIACFHLLVWATSGGEHGLLQAARRHPYRFAVVAALLGGLILGVANLDFLLAPGAWPPRHVVRLSELDESNLTKFSQARNGSLSRNGDWLIVQTYNPALVLPGDWKLYRLAPTPHVVPFSSIPAKRAAFLAFDCDQDRLAYVDYEPIAGRFDIHVVDLATMSDTLLPEAPRDGDIHSLQWLPGGSLVIYYGDDWYGKTGYTKFEPHGDAWTRQESEQNAVFDTRSGKLLEFGNERFGNEGLRIVEPTSRECDAYSQEWLDSMREFVGGDLGQWFKLSPNARFILAGGKCYDRKSKTFREWRVDEGFPQPLFHAFTPSGHAVYTDHSSLIAWHHFYNVDHVPFGRFLMDWLWRERVRSIDPTDGRAVARTQPLRHSPHSVTLSHDGSRMAVFNSEGVLVYDVPAEFR